jgi:hypothetical protein
MAMGDRTLTELAWRAFAKGRGLKEAPLAKALAELAKVERAGPESVLKALDEVDAQVDELRGAKKSDMSSRLISTRSARGPLRCAATRKRRRRMPRARRKKTRPRC